MPPMVPMPHGRTEPDSAIAKATGLSRQVLYRIKDERADMEAALVAWGI
jgi:hypothetical protein